MEKDILDSKENIEFYRTKMQELVSCFYISFVYVFCMDFEIYTKHLMALSMTVNVTSVMEG